MNKLSLSIIAASAIALASCSSDEPAVNPVNGGYNDGKVSFTIDAPGVFSRATADGLSATELNYAVFDTDGNFLFEEKAVATLSNRETTVSIPLVLGKSYKVAFFAKSPDAPYTVDNGVVSLNYDTDLANDDSYDAFYTVKEVTVTADMAQQQAVLTRPFAQVNVGATDWAIAQKAGFEVSKTALSFTAEVYTTLNLIDGTADNAAEVTFALNTLPDFDTTPATLTVAGAEYEHVAMAYILPADGESQLVNTVTFTYTDPTGTDVPLAVNSVPVQRNHRTNIIGRFFTTDVDYKIIVDQNFDEPDNVVNEVHVEMTWADFCALRGISTKYDSADADIVADGKNEVIITDWVDAWYAGNLTVRNLIFKQGATFTAKNNGLTGTVLFENNTFNACDWNAVKDALTNGDYTADGKRIDNAGGGLCLNIETKNSPNLEVIVRDNIFEGENNIELPRKHSLSPSQPNNMKARGHAVAINAISGGGNTMAKNVTIEDNTMTGIRGNAIQLYSFAYPIVVRNNTINSWGRNAKTAAKSDTDFAVRGDIKTGGALTLEGNYFGMDEEGLSGGVNHVKVNDYENNTDGTRQAGTY